MIVRNQVPQEKGQTVRADEESEASRAATTSEDQIDREGELSGAASCVEPEILRT